MLGFNINLDLSVYFDDLRKLSCVFVDLSKCKNVRDVEQHIKCLFELEDDICLIHEQFLLPKFEDAQVFRQCGIIQVKICDFCNDEKDKKEHENGSTNNLALNLIQIEKTVDLSCKPKQRFKSNLTKSYCKASEVTNYFVESNIKEKFNQSFCTDTYCNNNSKDKNKIKKKRNKFDSLNQDHNEDTGSDILDMSVNKGQKACHDNCFLPKEDCISKQCTVLEKKLNCGGDYELSQNKHKKRKILPDCISEQFNDPVTSNDICSKIKKRKSKKSCLGNENQNQESSYVLEKFCNSEDIESKNLKFSAKGSQRYTLTKDCKPLQSEKKEFQQIKYDCSSNMAFNNYKQTESRCDSEKSLDEKKKLYQNHIDTLLANCSSKEVFSENGGGINSNCPQGTEENKDDLHQSSFYNHVGLSQNESDQTVQSCEQSFQSFLESSDTKIKRKRVRKHRRRNKTSQYLEAVGPLLSNLTEQNEVNKSSIPSTSAKHIYFGDNDRNEESMVNTTMSGSLETNMQGSFETNDLNNPQASKEFPKWQEELMKLASAPKPIIFQRFGEPKINLHQTSSPKDHSRAFPSPDIRNQNGACTSPCSTVPVGGVNKDVKSCYSEENSNNIDNNCTHEATISSEKLTDSIKPISIDLQNVNLSNYPVIDTVVAEDLILFQLLKLNENCEPDVSKVILAKVKCLTNFPDKLSLEIIEGSEECELSTRADGSSEETIVELMWRDLIEPRLFYP